MTTTGRELLRPAPFFLKETTGGELKITSKMRGVVKNHGLPEESITGLLDRLYNRGEGMTKRKIGEKLGIATLTVTSWMRECGIQPRDLVKASKAARSASMTAYWQSERSVSHRAHLGGTSRAELITNRAREVLGADPGQELNRLVNIDCFSAAEIAERLQRSKGTIRRWFKFFNVKVQEGRPQIRKKGERELVLKALAEGRLDALTPLQREILEKRYFPTTGRVLTFEEIAGELGLSDETVRQIKNNALRELGVEV